MTGMVADHFYRVVLAMGAAVVLACVLTIFAATADEVQASGGIASPQYMDRG